MITHTPAAKEEPFSFVRPQLPARPASDGAELEANRATLLPAAQAYAATEEILQRATAEAERLGKDSNLTAQGKRAAFAKLAITELPKLRDHLSKLDAAGAALQAEAGQVQTAKAPPAPTEAQLRERANIAAAFGRLNEKQKLAQLERAATGKDPELAHALAYSHPLVSGLGDQTVNFLRAEIERSQVDADAMERVKDKAFKLGAVRRVVIATLEAVERAADHTQLKEAKVATLRRSDLTEQQKRDYIDQRGYKAFTALPA